MTFHRLRAFLGASSVASTEELGQIFCMRIVLPDKKEHFVKSVCKFRIFYIYTNKTCSKSIIIMFLKKSQWIKVIWYTLLLIISHVTWMMKRRSFIGHNKQKEKSTVRRFLCDYRLTLYGPNSCFRRFSEHNLR